MFVFKKGDAVKKLSSDAHKDHLLANGWKLENAELKKPKKEKGEDK